MNPESIPRGVTVVCPVCACHETSMSCEIEGRRLLICHDCRHLYWEIMPTQDELDSLYGERYSDSHGQREIQEEQIAYYRTHVVDLASRLISEGRPQSDLAIADIGCSYPVFLAVALEAGCRMGIGVDLSEDARLYGAQRGVRVMDPDAFLAEVPDASLDVLRYAHTLEHLPDPAEVLRAQIRKLRPGGLLYITQPNTPMLRVGPVPPPFDAVYPEHLHFFTPASALVLVEQAGCYIEQLFSHGDPDVVSARHRSVFDLEYSSSRLIVLEHHGETAYGPLSNFPFFFGRNSAIYARRVTCP